MTTGPDATWARALAVFDHAVAIADPLERERMVTAACDGDDSLGEAVRRLLDADATASPLLDTPAAEHAAQLVDGSEHKSEPAPAIGPTVGPYRIRRELGHGGMGVVFLAERDDVPMRVALKLVRGGLAASERVKRFLLERHVLARLEHPNIARMLDVGVTDDGTPWFAMEYVEGEPIDQFCNARGLRIAERVALFERVCEAVQFAHRNLVVHRDLKPKNVLVVESAPGTPEPGVPKLLDFGIAKLLDDGADAGLTRTATRVMTPEYAAPEQVRGKDITTATDVYALGVVLYELLTGRRPYVLRATSFAEIARAVLEAKPPRLSTVVTNPRERRQLAGDLDAIVAKALEKEPARRYPSAEALLRDLWRHRKGHTVSARPATVGYRVRTFVRRHRVLVTSTAAVVLLLGGLAGSMAYQQAQTARALRRAEAETEKARDVTRFLVETFGDADPYQGGTANTSAALDAATERIERELAGQPEVRGELLHQLGVIQRNLGRYDKAEQLLRRAIDDRRGVLAPNDTTDRGLATLYYELGWTLRLESSYPAAEEWLRRALAMRQAVLPPDHPDVASAMSELGSVRRTQGHYAEAIRLYEQAIAIQEKRGETSELATTLDRLSEARITTGDLSGAEPLVRRVIAIRTRVLGPDHPLVASAFARLAGVLHDVDVDGALQAARQAVAIGQRRLGRDHPVTLSAASELSLLLQKKGDLQAAESLQREVLAGRRRLHGEYHRDVAGSIRNLSGMARQRGDLAEAEAMARRSMEIYRRVTGAETDVAPLVQDLAVLRHERGDAREAVTLARQVVGFRGQEMWMWDPQSASDLLELASVLAKNGDCDGARTLSERSTMIYGKLSTHGRANARPEKALSDCVMPR